jgi:AraC-like DNA-binding protein
LTELVDEPVIQYVTRSRMRIARSALETERASVAKLAHRLGYRSEAAFARAFKRLVGVPPGAVRRAGDGARAALADAPALT